MNRRIAAFLDRDGTIIRDASYMRDPDVVELLPGAAAAIRKLNEHDVAVVVITNQSGIARGMFTEREYELVRERVDELLVAAGARIDATYMCPHHPDITGPCDCRKPGIGLYAEAIAEHGLDPDHSLFAGDRWRDVAAAAVLGGLGILIDAPSTHDDDRERARVAGIQTVRNLGEAVDEFLRTLPQ